MMQKELNLILNMLKPYIHSLRHYDSNIIEKHNSFKKLFQEYHQSNSLDPDQARLFVTSDAGPNCSQRLSADDTSRQRVK